MEALFTDSPTLAWALIGIGLLILEIVTPGFLVLFFGVGALSAMIPAVLGLGLAWQLGVFALVSILSLILFRPFLVRLYGRHEPMPTGIQALVGRRVVLRNTIAAGAQYGEVNVDGDVWRAQVEGGARLESGSQAEIVGHEGIILVLRPVHEHSL